MIIETEFDDSPLKVIPSKIFSDPFRKDGNSSIVEEFCFFLQKLFIKLFLDESLPAECFFVVVEVKL